MSGAGRGRALALLALAAALIGGDCGGGSGDSGLPVLILTQRLDPRCAVVPSAFPAGLAFVPGAGDRLLVGNFSPTSVLPLDVSTAFPSVAPLPPVLAIPNDSDGDGIDEGGPIQLDAPKIDDLFTADPALASAGLGLITASDYEEVILFDPQTLTLRAAELSVPDGAGFAAGDYPRLPAPGLAALRTAVTAHVCVKPDETIDSFGNDYAAGLPAFVFCDPTHVGSYYASFTSGAALAAGHLFVSSSNVGNGAGSASTQYLPGSVLVYDVDLAADPPRISPNPDVPYLLTQGYNPTHVTRYAAGAREFVLVSVSGALGIVPDNPATSVVEGGTRVLSDAAIEVIDAQTLRLVGVFPLGPAALGFDRLAIDPTGRIAAAGSAASRSLYAVDLAPLALLPADPVTPVVLANAVIFDAADPFPIRGRPGGPNPASCPGATGGVAWSDAGRLYVTERCDGTFTILGRLPPAQPGDPIDPASFFVVERQDFVAPLTAETLGQLRDPGIVRVRPGRPGVDFSGPDVFVAVSQPEGSVCAVRIASP